MEGVVPKVLNLAQVDRFAQQALHVSLNRFFFLRGVSLNSLNTAKNNFHGVGPRNGCVTSRNTVQQRT